MLVLKIGQKFLHWVQARCVSRLVKLLSASALLHEIDLPIDSRHNTRTTAGCTETDGMNFSRRGLDMLTAAVQAKQIDAVLVKDLLCAGRAESIPDAIIVCLMNDLSRFVTKDLCTHSYLRSVWFNLSKTFFEGMGNATVTLGCLIGASTVFSLGLTKISGTVSAIIVSLIFCA